MTVVGGKSGPGAVAYGLIGGVVAVGIVAVIMVADTMRRAEAGRLLETSVTRPGPKHDRERAAVRPVVAQHAPPTL